MREMNLLAVEGEGSSLAERHEDDSRAKLHDPSSEVAGLFVREVRRGEGRYGHAVDETAPIVLGLLSEIERHWYSLSDGSNLVIDLGGIPGVDQVIRRKKCQVIPVFSFSVSKRLSRLDSLSCMLLQKVPTLSVTFLSPRRVKS